MTGPGGKETGRVSVKVVPDMSGFAKKVKAYLRKLDKELEVRVKVKVDDKTVKDAVKNVAKDVQQAFGKNDGFDLSNLFKDMDLGPTERAFARIAMGLGSMADRAGRLKKSIGESVDAMKGFGRATLNVRRHVFGLGPVFRGLAGGVRRIRSDGLYRTFIRTSDAAINLTKNVTKVGKSVSRLGLKGALAPITGAVRGFAKLAAGAGKAAGSILGMSRALLITVGVLGIAAPLVGLIAGLLAGLPSLAVAGGAAIAAIALGFDGIKKAAKVLKPEVEKLKASLSATFEKGLTPVFKQLAKVFPVLEKGLNQVAVGLISMAQGFTDVVTSSEGLSQIKQTLANTGQFFKDLTPFVKDFTGAFLTLATEGSKSFDILSGTLNKFAADFKAMVNRVAADGTLREAFVGLGKITDSLLSLFTKLFEAGLRVLPQIAGPFSAFIDSLANALVAIMPALGIISNFMSTILAPAFDAIAQIVKALEPGLQSLANVLGTVIVGAIKILAPIFVALATILSKFFVMVEKALGPILQPLIDFFVELATMIGDFLVEAFDAILPLTQAFLDFWVELFEAIKPLMPELKKLAEEILSALLEVIKLIVPIAVKFVKEVLPKLIEIVKKVLPVILDLITFFTDLYTGIQNVVAFVRDNFGPVFEAAAAIVGGVFESLSETVSNGLDFLGSLFEFFKDLVTGNWDELWGDLKNIAADALALVTGPIESIGDTVVKVFEELPQKAKDALGDIGNFLVESGKALINGFIDGIKRRTDAVVSEVKGVLEVIRLMLPFSPAKTGPFSGRGYTLYSGMALMEGFAEGVRRATPSAVSAMDGALSKLHTDGSFDSTITANSSGSLLDGIVGALSGWTVEFDPNGVARMVNTANTKKARRG